MKSRTLAAFGLAAAVFVISGSAQAHGRGYSHSRVGVYIGVPLLLPGVGYYYSPYAHPGWPYYGYPSPAAALAVPEAPTTYVERASSAQSPAPSWYWCQQPQGYYPTVSSCPGGWMAVPAQPSAQAPRKP